MMEFCARKCTQIASNVDIKYVWRRKKCLVKTKELYKILKTLRRVRQILHGNQQLETNFMAC